jgi:hypothetical protein
MTKNCDSIKTRGFTLAEYRRLISATSLKYPCVGFEVLESPLPTFAILRHDVDMSPLQALELAKIESALGVRATYTVLLTGEFYSPFEHTTRQTLRAIAALGHDIGLHFDAAWHGIESEKQLHAAIKWEVGVLNELLDLPDERRVQMFSFHNTTPFTMACKSSHYAGLRNAYAGFLQQEVQYTSDSNGYWIHRSWDQLIQESPLMIQVLTHPEWWRQRDLEPAEKVCSQLHARATNAWVSYRTLLQRGSRQNRTGLRMPPERLAELYPEDGDRLMLLWLSGSRVEAFVELYCRFERQSWRLLRQSFRRHLKIPACRVNAMMNDHRLSIDPLLALSASTGKSVLSLTGLDESALRGLRNCRNALAHGYKGVAPRVLVQCFEALCTAIGTLAESGEPYLIGATGTRRLSTKEISVSKGDADVLSLWLRQHRARLGLSLKAIVSFEDRNQDRPMQGKGRK